MFIKRVLRTPEDVNPSGGTPAPSPAPAPAPVVTDDISKRLAALEEENRNLKERLAPPKKKERQEDETTKRLAALEEENKRLTLSAKTRLEATVATFPEAEKKLFAELSDALPFATWAEKVEAYAASRTSSPAPKPDIKPVPPPTGEINVSNRKGYEPSPEAKEILDQMMRSDDVLKTVHMEKDPNNANAWRFYKPVKEFIRDMPRKFIPRLSHEEAMRRKLNNSASK